jgi:hypothetical protein
MTRDNNIYGKLVNNKFSDLLTANMNSTWQQMHAILDRKMPQDREKRWLLWIRWRSAGTAIAFTLLAAAISLYSYQKHSEGSANTNAQERKILSDNTAEQDFLRMNTAASSGIANTISNPSMDNYAMKNDLIQRELFPLTNTTNNSNTDAEKHLNNYTGERYNSDGIVFYKRYLFPAMPVVDRLSSDKLLAKGDLVIPGHLSFALPEKKKPFVSQRKTGWVLGAAIHYNAPVSRQEMSTLNINGKKNTLADFIPSAFAQYHFNNKWYVETGFQFSSPQYTPDLKLFSSCVDVAAGKRKEAAVWLNKLYYMSIPLSVHFKPFRGFSAGTGIQYSFLKRSLLMDEHAGWKEDDNGEWKKTYSTITVKPTKNKSKGNANSNNNTADNGNAIISGWGTPSAGATPASNGVALISTQFKSADWRYLVDLNYTWKRYTLGTRYTAGLNNYISTKAEGNMLEVKDKNKAIQFYLRMNVFDWRKKTSSH